MDGHNFAIAGRHGCRLRPEIGIPVVQQRAAFPSDHETSPADFGRSKAYAVARRHSSRVRLLRVALPVGALLLAVSVPAFIYLSPLANVPGLTLGPISLAGSKVKMEGPRLTGFRDDHRPYEVTATAAFQDIRRPNVIELKDMRARLAVDQAGTMATLQAKGGVFDTGKEQLELSEDIRVATDRGDEAFLKTASVDFKAGKVVSHEAVRLVTSTLTLEAGGIEVSDGGATLTFTGRVRTRLLPPPAKSDGTAPARILEAQAGTGR